MATFQGRRAAMPKNGRLSSSALAAITRAVNGDQARLRVDAARAFMAMNAESERRYRVTLRVSSARTAYRTLAEQVYFWGLYRAGRGSLAARPGTSNHGLGLAVDLATPRMRQIVDQIGAKYGWAKRWSDAPCVPLDTRILTRSGWKTWDEVVEGEDETIGYNPETQMGEWTPIHTVYRQRGDLLVHEHSRLRLEATSKHRWLTPGRGLGPAALRTIEQIDAADPQASLLLAAPAESGIGLPITTEEAALLGWALTDGSIYRFDNSRGRRAYARVYQKKAVGVAAVETLMGHFEHRRFDDWTGESSYSGGASAWYVGRAAFSPVLKRSRLDEVGPVGMVAAMTVAQRRAFLSAAQMAEGGQRDGMRQIAQSKPDVKDAIALAAALEGHLVTLRSKTVNLVRARVQRDHLTTTEAGRAETWCPATGLGSWLAEQNGQVFLTGNSEWWHLRFRPGVYSAPPPDPHPTLRAGDRGAAVRRAQGLMRARGMVSVTADGVFGPATAAAARRLHHAYGYTASSHVGPAMWAILEGEHPWRVLTTGERELLADLQARRRSAGRAGGWDQLDASHLEAARDVKADLVHLRKVIWRKAQTDGWARWNRRRRYKILTDHTT